MIALSNRRPLTGLRVAISVSESADLDKRGTTPAGLNRLTVRLSRALLAEGAVLAFGHDWRNDGIMDAICGSAIESFGIPGIDVQPPLILNLIPWPDSPRTAEHALLRLEGILKVEEADLPEDVTQLRRELTSDPDLHRYLRGRGLTHLRRRLTKLCDARICIGGRDNGYSGRYPGVFEEALFSFEENKPTYLVGLLGGISESLGQALIKGSGMPTEFAATNFLRETAAVPSIADVYTIWSDKSQSSEYPEDRQVNPAAAWEAACRLGVARLKNNGLSDEENLGLLETTVEEEAIILILRGLRTCCALGRGMRGPA